MDSRTDSKNISSSRNTAFRLPSPTIDRDAVLDRYRESSRASPDREARTRNSDSDGTGLSRLRGATRDGMVPSNRSGKSMDRAAEVTSPHRDSRDSR
jgi:hypothetical protein